MAGFRVPRATLRPCARVFRNAGPRGQAAPALFGSLSLSVSGEFSDAWPLMRSPVSDDDVSFPDSCAELPGEDGHSLSLGVGALSPHGSRRLVGGAAATRAPSENCAETTDVLGSDSPAGPAPTQEAPASSTQPDPAAQPPLQVSPGPPRAEDPRGRDAFPAATRGGARRGGLPWGLMSCVLQKRIF